MAKSKDELACEVIEKIGSLWMAFGKEQLDTYMQQHGEQKGIRPHYHAGWAAGVRMVIMLQAVQKMAGLDSPANEFQE